MRTPWSKPQISSQPAGNTTLVNLTTFYKVNWAVEGFQPGEVDRSVLRGIPVQIRPKLVGFTYVFGDGSSVGPTTSTGGVYPERRHHARLPGEGRVPGPCRHDLRGRFQPGRLHVGRDPLDRHRAGPVDDHHSS